MTDYVDSWPTARRRHRCGLCCRSILPGETYWRQASLDHGQAWTHKTCEHCERVAWAFCRVMGESEWDQECVLEWLSDEHPADLAAFAAGWRWPDGDLVPVPFGSRCVDCRARVEFRALWCPPCDDKRVTRIEQGFRAIAAAFEEAKA